MTVNHGFLTLRDNTLTAIALQILGVGSDDIANNHLTGTVTIAGNVSIPDEPSITFVNNVLSAHDTNAPPLQITGAAPNSLVAFNTLINDVPTFNARIPPLRCDSNDDVVDNIIAWGATMKISCTTTFSLFDQYVTTIGATNQGSDVSTFFVDLANGDFHLAPGSPAIGAGSALPSVSTDIEGKPRSTPPDLGAYDAQ